MDNFETLNGGPYCGAVADDAAHVDRHHDHDQRPASQTDVIELHGLGTRTRPVTIPSEDAAFFIERVRQERMRLPLTQTDRQLVEAICRRPGGHPLAIELAAA
ncbi:MAG: hypothetical protein R3A10_14980 [Caldilineaceae bacterium]